MRIGSLLKKLCLTCMSGCILLAGGCALETPKPETAVNYEAINLELIDVGMCLYDLTGDGIPEVCFEVSTGSGFIVDKVIAYDMVSKKRYILDESGTDDYYLSIKDGKPFVLKREHPWHGSPTPGGTEGWMVLEQIDGTDDYELIFDSELKYEENKKSPESVDLKYKEAEVIKNVLNEPKAYLYDITGDGAPEVFVSYIPYSESVMFEHVQAYDWVEGKMYSLDVSDGCEYDLDIADGKLCVIRSKDGESGTEMFRVVLKLNEAGNCYALELEAV